MACYSFESSRSKLVSNARGSWLTSRLPSWIRVLEIVARLRLISIVEMAIGPAIRRALRTHPRIQSTIANAYRSMFVDVRGLVNALPIPCTASSLLNVGTGDGTVLNLIARQFPALQITTADIGELRGELLDSEIAARIQSASYKPNDYSEKFWSESFDVVLLVDVIHHVPVVDRPVFLRRIWSTVAPSGVLLVKDFEPRGIRAFFGLLSDRYITGDRHVRLISARDLAALLTECSVEVTVTETDLASRDYPNYLLVCNSAGTTTTTL